MADGGIKSPMRFESYKIDNISFEMQRTLQLLAITGNIDPKAWEFKVAIGKPSYFASANKYVSSLNVGLFLLAPKDEQSEQKGTAEIAPLVKCELSITGLFSVEEGRLTKEVEMNLLKLQLPAILLPYARSAITSILANGGFGSVVLPLINMQEVARRVESTLDVEVIE